MGCAPIRPRPLLGSEAHAAGRSWGGAAQAIRARLQQDSGLQPFLNRVLRLSCQDETAVVPTLNHVASEFGDSVTLGSYPVRPPDCPLLAVAASTQQHARRCTEGLQQWHVFAGVL